MNADTYVIRVDRKTKHDLRACLNVIIGYTEMLLEQSGEQQQVSPDDLKNILGAARKMLTMLDQLFKESGGG